jgi:hypothetical protein
MPMPTYRNTNCSPVFVLLAMVLICVLFFTGPVLRPAMNKLLGGMALRKFETAFQDVQHPVGTERLSLRATMGDFPGIELGCDFFVGEVRSYVGSEEGIIAAYTGQVIKGNPLQVVFLENGQIPARVSDSLPVPLDNLTGWDLPPGMEQQPSYMVYLLIADYVGNLRFDCQ